MRFKYCPKCGKQDSIIEETATEFHCENCGFEFWNNPAATVSAVFIKGDEALFAKRGREPNKGKYDFPGGFLEYNEDLYVGCAREVYEETGLTIDVKDMRLITGYAREYIPGQSVVDLIIVIKRWPAVEPVPQDDVAALEWKPLDFINDSQFAPREYASLIEKLRAIA